VPKKYCIAESDNKFSRITLAPQLNLIDNPFIKICTPLGPQPCAKKICLIFFVSDEHISSDEEDSPRIINSKFKIEIDSIQVFKY
jgi:hypothetical protein